MQTIAKKVVQNWAAKGYISDDEVEMCLYNLIRHTFTVAVLCVLTVVGALLGEWSNTIVLIVSILFLRTYTNGYHCKSCLRVSTTISEVMVRRLTPKRSTKSLTLHFSCIYNNSNISAWRRSALDTLSPLFCSFFPCSSS